MRHDVTLRIKNLSISLEALSRINVAGAQSLYIDIETLLEKEINEAKEEQNPTRTTPTIIDDIIPF